MSLETQLNALERAERVQRLQVPRVVSDLGLKSGNRVADIGAGSGLFSRAIAHEVGTSGIVYAVDVDEGLLAIVARRAHEEGLENIRTIKGGEDDPRLPGRVDLVLLCDTLHHIARPADYVATIRKYLNPGARVAILDYQDSWPPGHESMRYTVDELRRWMSAAGYRELAHHDYLSNMFFVVWTYSRV